MSKLPNARAHTPILPPPLAPRAGRSRRNLAPEVWRERIIATALILGNDHGDDAISGELVANAAGLSRAHLYTFFPNLSELHRAVVTARGRALASHLVVKVKQSRGVDAKVQRLVHEVFRLSASPRQNAGRNGTSAAGLGGLLYSMRASAAGPIGRELAGANSSPLIGHAVIAMSEGAALAWATNRRPSRQASIDIAVRLIRDVLLSQPLPSADVSHTRPKTRGSH